MNIIYVTTFNKPIWEASTVSMIQSFLFTKTDGQLLSCYEDFSSDPIKKQFNNEPSLLSLCISDSKFLKRWLKDNEDIIPPAMGGKAIENKKPQAFLPWNYRAAGWFRKIVALDAALELYGDKCDAIVFIDSDTIIKKKIDESLIESAFGSYSFFYHWGQERPKKGLGVESGFIGFKTDEIGRKALNYWINKYKSNSFRRYLMWDDGGMFGNVVLELQEIYNINGNDLVTNYKENGKSQSHVIERGMFSEFLVHEKGKHKSLGLIK